MIDPREPPRLLAPGSGAEEDLRRLLEGARADVLAPDALRRVTDGVERALAGAEASAPHSGPARGRGARVSAARLVTVAAAAASLAAAAWLWVSPAPPLRTPPVSPAASSAPEIAPPSSATSAPVPAPVEPSHPPASPPPARTTAIATAASPPRPLAISSAAPPDAKEEHRLLRAARAALATDPRQALALAAEHERLFPHGMLAEEREVIAIEALAASGAGDAARERLARFHREFPGSVHQPRLDVARPPPTP